MVNYIPDVNKFALAGPPKWWLKQLWHFDSSLVVVPSRMGFYYRLSQKRQPNLSTDIVNESMRNADDTAMLASYGLIPVTTILATANWSNPYLFEELRRRAPWRLGGAQKVADALDEADVRQELDKRIATDEYLNSLAKDSWRLYQKKIGLRSNMYSPRTAKPSYRPDPRIQGEQARVPQVTSIWVP